MDQGCTGLVKGLPAAGIQLQTQVDIVECDRELRFVKSLDRKEFIAGDYEASGGDRAHALRE